MFAVSADGRLTQARSERQWAGGRATVGITAGKHYYEAAVRDDGLVRVVRLYPLFFFIVFFSPSAPLSFSAGIAPTAARVLVRQVGRCPKP